MTLTGENRITLRETCRSAALSITNYTWTGRCDTCTNKRLGHGTTRYAAWGGTKIMFVSGFQVNCFLYLVHKSFEIT